MLNLLLTLNGCFWLLFMVSCFVVCAINTYRGR